MEVVIVDSLLTKKKMTGIIILESIYLNGVIRMQWHIKGKINTINISTGHKSHKSGAGVHADKRDKRHHTRSAKLRRALED